MYARLWWKDARQFWPIWAFLAVAAAVVQGLLLYFFKQDARHGWLGASALLCTSLYAFATGAAAFAAERETGTLRLLDVLPADRRVVWLSKVSFAFFTTFLLAVMLLAMAAVSTEKWRLDGPLSVTEAVSFCMLVPVALGWGLFWSAILSNALTAAVLAICCTGVSLGRILNPLLAGAVLPSFTNSSYFDLVALMGALIASITVFVRAVRWNRLPFEIRSPVTITPPRSQAQLSFPSRVSTSLASVQSSLFEAVVIVDRTDFLPPRSWILEARAMVWQTMMEARKTWCLLAAIATLAVLSYAGMPNPFPERILLLGTGVALVAGASVFGLENRARTQRFLTHHGARAGLVWPVKLAVWGVAVVVIWGPFVLTLSMSMWFALAVLGSMVILSLPFAIALVCGMAIPRGITAIVIAFVIYLVLMIPVGTLVSAGMLPLQGLLVIATGFLLVSWAWRGDWLLERPGSGRWVRLGLLVGGMFTVLVPWFAGYRAWGIRDVGPIALPAAWLDTGPGPLPVGQNAALYYREAGRRLVHPVELSQDSLKRNRDVVSTIRHATELPHCRFFDPQKLTAVDRLDLPAMDALAILLALDASERENHGDLAAAWDDIVALFRMADQIRGSVGRAMPPFSVEELALGATGQWALARGQTPERLHEALAFLRDRPKVSLASEVIRAQAALVEQALDLPVTKFRDWAYELIPDSTFGIGRALEAATIDLTETPWERARARRLNRLVAHAALRDAGLEPWQRSQRRDPELERAKIGPRAVMTLIGNPDVYVRQADADEVFRRALVQIIAIRSWQLKHRGEFPKNLDVLVPDELPELPADPYSGRPFGYRAPTDDRRALSPGDVSTSGRDERHTLLPGSRVIYSVGPNFRDDGGVLLCQKNGGWEPGDIVFEIRPMEKDAKAGSTRESKSSQ